MSRSNQNSAPLGGAFSSENESSLEKIENENVFERIINRVCNNDGQKYEHDTPKMTTKTANDGLEAKLDEGDGFRTETNVEEQNANFIKAIMTLQNS